MENINISVGLELDKSQFNEKYVQGAIDDSVKNASIKIDNIKLGDVSKKIPNELTKQASRLKIQIKDVDINSKEIDDFIKKAEQVSKSFNEKLSNNIKITGDLDLKNVEAQIKNDLKYLTEDLSKSLGIDGSKISITGIRGAARDFIETFQSEIKSFAISPKVGSIDLGIIDNLDDELISKIKKSFNSDVAEEFKSLGKELGILFSADFIREAVAIVKKGDLKKFNNAILDEFERVKGDYDFNELEKISNGASEAGRNIKILTDQSKALSGQLMDDTIVIKGLIGRIDEIKNASIKIDTAETVADVKKVDNEVKKLKDSAKDVEIVSVDPDSENKIKAIRESVSSLFDEVEKASSEMNNMLNKGFNDGSKKSLDEYSKIIVKGENLISSITDSGADFPDEEIAKLNEKLGDCFVLLAQVSDAHHEYLKNVQSETSKVEIPKVEVPVSIASKDIVDEIKDVEQEIEKVAENSNFEMPIDIVASEPTETIISGIEDIVEDIEDSGEFNIELDVFISEESKIRIQKQLEELSEGLSVTIKELKLGESSKLNIENVELATDMYAKIQSKIDDISNKIKLNINGVNLGEGIVNDIKKSFDELSKNVDSMLESSVDSIVNTLSDRLSKNIQLDFNKIKFSGLKDRIAEINQSFNDGIEIKPSVTLSGADVKIDSTSKITESVISATDDVDIERLSSEHDKALEQITELQRNAELLKEGFKAYQDGMKNAFKKFETENSHLLNYIRGLEKEFDTPVFKKLVKYKKELNNIIEEYNTLGVELTEVEKTRNETYDGKLFTVQYKQYLDTLGLDANKFEVAVERAKEIVARKRQLLKNLEKNLSKATEEEQDVFKELSNAYAKLPKVNTSRTDSLREALVSIFEDDVFKLDFGKLDLRFEADLRSAYDEFFNVLREIQDEYNNKFKNIDGFKEIDIYKNISDSIKSDKLGRLKGEIDNLKGELANVVEIPESKTNTLEDNLGKIADELNVTRKTSQEAGESLRLMSNYGFDSGIAGARELNNRLQDIVATANEITNINYTFDIEGDLEKAFVTFKDQLGRMYSERFYWTMPEEEDEEPVFVSKLEKASEKFIDINKEALKMQDTLDNIKGNELVDISRIEKVQALIQKLVESIGDLNTEDARKQVDMLSNEIESISLIDKLMTRFDNAFDIRESMGIATEGLEGLRGRIQEINVDTPIKNIRLVSREIQRLGSGNSIFIGLQAVIDKATKSLENFGNAKDKLAFEKLNSDINKANKLIEKIGEGAVVSATEVRVLRESVRDVSNELKALENKKVKLDLRLDNLYDSGTIGKRVLNNVKKQVESMTTANVATMFNTLSKSIDSLNNREKAIKQINDALKDTKVKLEELNFKNGTLFEEGKLKKEQSAISKIEEQLIDIVSTLKKSTDDVDLAMVDKALEKLDSAKGKLEKQIDYQKQLNTLTQKQVQLRSALGELDGKIKPVEILKVKDAIDKMKVDTLNEDFKRINDMINKFGKSETQIFKVDKIINKLKSDLNSIKESSGFILDNEKVAKEVADLENYIEKLTKTREELNGGLRVSPNVLTDLIDKSNNSYNTLNATITKVLANKEKVDNLERKINKSISTRQELGVDVAALERIKENLKGVDLASQDASETIKVFTNEINNLGKSDSQIRKVQDVIEKLNDEIKDIEDSRGVFDLISTDDALRISNMRTEIAKLKDVLKDIENGAEYTTDKLQRMIDVASSSGKSISRLSNETSNIFSGLGSAINQGMQTALGFEFLDIFTDQLMQMKDAIVELDNEMVGLKRVSNETAERYDAISRQANQTAINMGKTTQETLNATTAFVKMGYSVSEASDHLSKAGLMLSNVAEMDIDSAVNAIVSTMKGMNYPVEEAAQRASEIVDVINEAGNKFALNSEDLAEGLRIGAASLKIAGNDLYESSALITAGTEVLQDSKQVANGLRTISMRLRGLSEDGEELNPKLEEMIKTMTGVDLTDTNGQFRSTYDILLDITKVWDTLDTKQQALLLENIAGKTQV